MGHYLTVHSTTGETIRTMRIGTNGAGPFFVEQLIAGYAISPDADGRDAKKVRRHWLRPIPRPGSDWLRGDLRSRRGLVRALQDDTDGCSWVRCSADLDRTVMRHIRCKRLFALVGLWHMATTYYDWDPMVRVSAILIDAIEMSTAALEEVGAPWAAVCREAADLLQQAGPGARLSIG